MNGDEIRYVLPVPPDWLLSAFVFAVSAWLFIWSLRGFIRAMKEENGARRDKERSEKD